MGVWKQGAWSPDAWAGTAWGEGVVGELNCTLLAAEAQDTAAFTASGEQEEEQGGWSEYVRPIEWPLRLRLAASEEPDTARFTAVFDFTDDELVLLMMAAAYEDEEMLV
jgi:hypothetical protein